ncbi:hypothetical protein [Carboxydothermus ferrireducens]|uniref:Uncharacterized protein n=1 Tax=Carboxydothermus ferrireducens DSM 11255 TaxID=1119529 RepID=A0ABX2RBE5_9THEO|nr:hypothetical protein [Carboxydothermus ferrireducens]NYE57192.1 hypothetical protein [Carboxydothermus ferrireducens DSM 11255]
MLTAVLTSESKTGILLFGSPEEHKELILNSAAYYGAEGLKKIFEESEKIFKLYSGFHPELAGETAVELLSSFGFEDFTMFCTAEVVENEGGAYFKVYPDKVTLRYERDGVELIYPINYPNLRVLKAS